MVRVCTSPARTGAARLNVLDPLEKMRGNMSLFKVRDPDAYERANCMLMLQGGRA
jgi:hypothetical protein